MNKEDIKFLKELQEKIKKQNPSCWVIQEEKIIYNVSYNEDGYLLLDDSGEELCNINYNNMIEDIYKWLKEELEGRKDIKNIKHYKTYSNYIRIDLKYCDYIIENVEDLKEVLKNIDENKYEDYDIRSYKIAHRIAAQTFFITKKECEEHIKEYGYHYSNPKPLCIKAWRSPQVERLYNILKNTDWNKIGED